MGSHQKLEAFGDESRRAGNDYARLVSQNPRNQMIYALYSDPRIDGFEALPEPLLLLCSKFRMVYANPAWLQLAGCTRRQVIGKLFFDLFPEPPKRMEAIKRSLEKVIAGQTIELKVERHRARSQNLQFTNNGQAAETRYRALQYSPVYLDGIADPLILQTSRDVTEIVAVSEQLSVQIVELQHRLREASSLVVAVLRTSARGQNKIGDLVQDVAEFLCAIPGQQELLTQTNVFPEA